MNIYPQQDNYKERLCHVLEDDGSTIEIIEYPSDVVTYQFSAQPPSAYGSVMAVSIVGDDTLAGYECGHLILFKKVMMSSCIKPSTSLTCFAVNSKRVIVVGTTEDEIIIVHILEPSKTLTEHHRISLTNSGINCVTWRNDDRMFATGGWDGLIRLFSAKTFKQLTVLRWDVTNKSSQLCLVFSDEHYLVSGSDDKVICVWDVYR